MIKTARFAVLIGCLIGLGAAVESQTIHLGAGAQSCGRWLVGRQGIRLFGQSFDNTGITVAMVSSWMQGFAFGASSGGRPDAAALARVIPDEESLQAWTDNYCRAHPLDDIRQASATLVAELVDRIPK